MTSKSTSNRGPEAAGRLAHSALLALPGALTVYLSFNAGGFFPQTPAFVALILALILAARLALAGRPLQGFSRPLAIAAGALALYAVWTLASGIWSDAPGRALLEFDRVLLYLLALILFGSFARDSACLRWMIRGLALGIAIVGIIALVTRVLPEVWPVDPNFANNRLSYPLTYWNSLGLLSAVGVILCFHVTSSRGEPGIVRVLSALCVPLLATTVYFSFSRGAIAAGILGLVVYTVLGRPRALLTGLIAVGPPTAIALVVAYDADLLATPNPTTDAAISQGQDLAIVLVLCAGAAAFVRALLLAVDARLSLPKLSRETRRVVQGATAAGAVVFAVVLALALQDDISRQYDRFVRGGGAGQAGDFRQRLTDPANNGRLGEWRVALDGYRAARLNGEGAGTYQVLWARDRTSEFQNLSVRDAHSLYVETLGELGLIGAGLLVVSLGAIGFGLLHRRSRKRHRPLYSAIFAVFLVWLLRAGVDWDWEMPAVTLWLFALGGAAIAASGRRRRSLFGVPSPPLRAALAVGCLVVAIVPALVLISQTRLDNSADAFKAGKCPEAVDEARASTSALGMRPEPYEIIAFCEARVGSPERGIEAIEKAIDRDPLNWEYRYGLAIMRGVAGQNPRPAARRALLLNRFNPEALEAVNRFRTSSRQEWRRQANYLLRRSTPFYLSDG
jgi:O-antigen ligase